MNVIGLSGKMGTGKTTLANLICSMVPGAVRMSFADTLREEVAEHFGFSLDLVRRPIFKDLRFRIGLRDMTGRELLQWWGTEVRRKADPDYWIFKMDGALCDCPADFIVVDDVRFRGEATLLFDWGNAIYRLDPYAGWDPGQGAGHESETALDDYPGFSARFSPEFGQLESLAREILARVES